MCSTFHIYLYLFHIQAEFNEEHQLAGLLFDVQLHVQVGFVAVYVSLYRLEATLCFPVDLCTYKSDQKVTEEYSRILMRNKDHISDIKIVIQKHKQSCCFGAVQNYFGLFCYFTNNPKTLGNILSKSTLFSLCYVINLLLIVNSEWR